ncbi:ribosome-binding factor A [Mesomycoplasma bovoculi]|uniref:Ribosome-binding factor A n=1 Tax=Mesomycoplasma bovoculi M165/69 TaxID=743966 RepID=W5V032_9BACT|nr:ribosome-binding factor A [Mesomycoplasma bovoculi]AHH45158.1 ribosome-binding factor A [Mesomycoplasma bovoculi M165/69]
MNNINHLKRETHFLRLISEIFQENFSDKFGVTVSWVKLTNDKSHLYIYLVFDQDEEQNLKYIQNAGKFIRLKLGNIAVGFKVPQLHFEIDPVTKRVESIDQILEKIHHEN